MGNGCAKGAMPSKSSIKVVLSDGTVEEFPKPITVAELMMEYPQHFVYHSSAITNNIQKKDILPADSELEAGSYYYLLPGSNFSGPVSPPKLPAPKPKPSSKHATGKSLKPEISREESHRFDITNWQSRPLDELVTRDDIDLGGLDPEDIEDEPMVSFSTPDLKSMYMQSQGGGLLMRCNSWKPRLETIHEVGSRSKKRIQNFVRGRPSLSQVHTVSWMKNLITVDSFNGFFHFPSTICSNVLLGLNGPPCPSPSSWSSNRHPSLFNLVTKSIISCTKQLERTRWMGVRITTVHTNLRSKTIHEELMWSR